MAIRAGTKLRAPPLGNALISRQWSHAYSLTCPLSAPSAQALEGLQRKSAEPSWCTQHHPLARELTVEGVGSNLPKQRGEINLNLLKPWWIPLSSESWGIWGKARVLSFSEDCLRKVDPREMLQDAM